MQLKEIFVIKLQDEDGDECDDDADGDKIKNIEDNCPLVHNKDQSDADNDGTGDACKNDCDKDGVNNNMDVCPCNSHASKPAFGDLKIATWIPNSDPLYHVLEPEWTYLNGRTEIHLKDEYHYGHGNIIYGNRLLTDVEYSGEFRVEEDIYKGFGGRIGIIFSFQVKKLMIFHSPPASTGTGNLQTFMSNLIRTEVHKKSPLILFYKPLTKQEVRNLVEHMLLLIDKPESESKVLSPSPKGKRNFDSGLVTKILWATTTPTHNF